MTLKLTHSIRLIALALSLAAAAGAVQADANALVVVHAGRLLDRPAQPARGASTILIRNGKVDAVREGFLDVAGYPGAQVIDLRGKFVLPGLIDSHVHLDSDSAGQEGLIEGLTNGPAYFAYEAAVNARKTLKAGFTTVRNLGNGYG